MDNIAKPDLSHLFFPERTWTHWFPESSRKEWTSDPILSDLHIISIGIWSATDKHIVNRADIGENILTYCAKGKGWFRYANRTVEIKPGMVFLIHKGWPHGYGADKNDPWTVYWIHFDGQKAKPLIDLIEAAYDRSPVFWIGSGSQVIGLFEEIQRTLQTGAGLRQIIHSSACLNQILTHLSLSRITGTASEAGVAVVLNLFQNRIRSFVRLDELASAAGMSKFHFVRMFRGQFGVSPIEYFLRLKMQKACEMLDATASKVGAVAEYLGYEDSFYFSRIFRRVVGLSPREYRKALRS